MLIFLDHYDIVRKKLKSALAAQGQEFAAEQDEMLIVLEKPPNAAFGDLATNAAMVFAKQLKINPRVVAEGGF